MSEKHEQRFGYRRHTDGKVVGWWLYSSDRDQAVIKASDEARKIGVDLVVDLVTERIVTTRRQETTRRGVRAA